MWEGECIANPRFLGCGEVNDVITLDRLKCRKVNPVITLDRLGCGKVNGVITLDRLGCGKVNPEHGHVSLRMATAVTARVHGFLQGGKGDLSSLVMVE